VPYNYCIYFTERPRNRLIRWNPDLDIAEVVIGESSEDSDQLLCDPYGITFFQSSLYVTDKKHHRICKVEKNRLKELSLLDVDGHRAPIPGVNVLAPRSHLCSPAGIFAEKDALLCAFSDDRTIYRIHSDGRLTHVLGILPNRPYAITEINEEVLPKDVANLPLYGPTAVVSREDQTIFFIERGYQTLRMYQPGSTLRCVFPYENYERFKGEKSSPKTSELCEYHPAYPSALAFLASKLYMADIVHRSIVEIDFKSEQVRTVLQVHSPGHGGPAGLTFGPDGTAWVIDTSTMTVQGFKSSAGGEWVPTGNVLTEIAGSPLTFFPAGAGIQCVPTNP
jgi:hypothetical protein